LKALTPAARQPSFTYCFPEEDCIIDLDAFFAAIKA
jgi:hypothetical protein